VGETALPVTGEVHAGEAEVPQEEKGKLPCQEVNRILPHNYIHNGTQKHRHTVHMNKGLGTPFPPKDKLI